MRKFDKQFVPACLFQSAILRTKLVPRPAPSVFFYPGLNSKPIYDPSEFAFSEILKANEKSLLQEYQKIVESRLPQSDYNLKPDEHSLHEGEWLWNSYIQKGKIQPNFAKLFPATAEMLDSIPRIMNATPFGSAFFSTLAGKSKIRAHHGPCNLRLRCHFPLIVPEGKKSGIRIGDQIVHWEVGKPLIFDDCYEHEVWNDSEDEPRVILLFDTW
jgi:aspartyl/asparaginyl beta-hydroxylase (cupin superfamily)